jgi:hypothetical protein
MLRKEQILRALVNEVLWRIYGCRKDKLTGEWKKLNIELQKLYFSLDIILVIKSK